jgi:hypothetical protein
VLGFAWIVLSLALFLLDRDTLMAGHPAHVIALAVTGLVGVVFLVWDRSEGYVRPPRRGDGPPLPVKVVLCVVTVVVFGALIWLRPFAATADAVTAMAGDADVRVTDAPADILISPTHDTPTRGLIFQPGARVDPRAYVPMLSEVSRAGFVVIIVKQPFGLAFLAPSAAHALMDGHPEVTAWAVAGHSLGGVVSATFAEEHPGLVKGLVLWASYPSGSLAGRTDLAAASISGTRDAFTTPADVEASRAELPADTAYTVVEGAVHSTFGDYGEQPGDGTPTGDRAAAQRQIVAATVALMNAL